MAEAVVGTASRRPRRRAAARRRRPTAVLAAVATAPAECAGAPARHPRFSDRSVRGSTTAKEIWFDGRGRGA
jgi:hypothetical protein